MDPTAWCQELILENNFKWSYRIAIKINRTVAGTSVQGPLTLCVLLEVVVVVVVVWGMRSSD